MRQSRDSRETALNPYQLTTLRIGMLPGEEGEKVSSPSCGLIPGQKMCAEMCDQDCFLESYLLRFNFDVVNFSLIISS